MQFYLIKALHRSDRPFIFFPSFAPTCVICYYYSCSYNFRRDNEKQRSTSVHYHYHDHCHELNCISYVKWVRVHVRIVSTEPKEHIVSLSQIMYNINIQSVLFLFPARSNLPKLLLSIEVLEIVSGNPGL